MIVYFILMLYITWFFISLTFSLECHTKQGKNCIFPFNFRGKNYNACTSDYSKKKIHHGKWSWMAKWCATAVHRNGTVIKNNWGYCEMNKNDHGKIYFFSFF